MFRVLVRTNPVNLSLHAFWDIINQIEDETPNAERARLFALAITESDLSGAATAFSETCELLATTTKEFVQDAFKELAAEAPGLVTCLGSFVWLVDPAFKANEVGERVRRAFTSSVQTLPLIQRRFEQLREHLPRYQAIMTRTGFLDGVLGSV
jgi:hypothetical protein